MAKPSELPSATTFGPNDFLIGNDGDATSRKTRKFSYSVLSSFVQSVASGEAGASVTWGEITDKPTEFTPSTHSHPVSQVTGLQTILDSKLETVAWDDVTSKPSTFAPSPHGHVISAVSGLQTALDGKASSSHSHAQSDITGLTAALAAKLDDAPNDGSAYARLGGAWVVVSTGGGGAVAWADITGKPTFFSGAYADLTGKPTISTFGVSLIDDADASTARATLGLGALAVKSTAATADIDNNAVTYAKMQTVAALSTPGRASNSTGVLADIVAGTDGHVLRRSGTTLGFGTLASGAFADNTIALSRLVQMADATIVGRTGGTTGAPSALTAAQVRAILSPGVLLRRSTAQSIPNATATEVTWDLEDYDDASFHSTSSNTARIVIPSGVTRVNLSAQIAFDISAGADLRYSDIYKNGLTSVATDRRSNAAGGKGECVLTTGDIPVAAGDYFVLRVFQASGSALNIDQALMWFSMRVVR